MEFKNTSDYSNSKIYLQSIRDVQTLKSIRNYTNNSTKLNDWLINPNVYDLNLINQILDIQNAILNAPKATEEITVYFMRKPYDYMTDESDKNMLELNDGDIINIPTFISTTYDENVIKYLHGFSDKKPQICCLNTIIIPKGFPLLCVETISKYPYQHEIILPKNLSLQVIKNTKGNLVYRPYIMNLDECHSNTTEIFQQFKQIIDSDPNVIINIEKCKDTTQIETFSPIYRILCKYINMDDFDTVLNNTNYFYHKSQIHGGLHISRALILSIAIYNFFIYTHTGINIDLNLLLDIVLYHDSGREGEGSDKLEWESNSAQNLINAKSYDNYTQTVIKNAITDQQSALDHNIIYNWLFKFCDSLEIIRFGANNNTLDFNKITLYNHFKKHKNTTHMILLNNLIKDYLLFLFITDVVYFDLNQVKTHYNSINFINNDNTFDFKHKYDEYDKYINYFLNFKNNTTGYFNTICNIFSVLQPQMKYFQHFTSNVLFLHKKIDINIGDSIVSQIQQIYPNIEDYHYNLIKIINHSLNLITDNFNTSDKIDIVVNAIKYFIENNANTYNSLKTVYDKYLEQKEKTNVKNKFIATFQILSKLNTDRNDYRTYSYYLP